ncbi:MAG TPA: 3-phosphoserine/phosphohydroxythreonine transaminase [Clostridia bacterium]|nr:3-phosphoserine/phosphohydroxythreonine transaminase [Clostridia bacterium]
MGRIHNFSPGPAVLPEEVLREAARDLVDYRGQGLSVMEMSHRSKAFEAILERTEADIRELAGIPDNYAVLFLQGGATTQFSMVPMNLSRNGKADFLLTGHWAQKAEEEAARFLDARVAASSEDTGFDRIPSLDGLSFRPDADYVHICENNTIFGTQFHRLPDTGGIPLVGDLSSDIFSRPLDIQKYALVYAGTQKNLGIAGLTLVIIRKDLVREQPPGTVPLMLNYHTHLSKKSMHNTPPTWAIYMTGLVARWLKDNGGLTAARERNERKAGLLYETLDESVLFKGTVKRDSRSMMNVVFTSGNKEIDERFVKGAEAAGLSGLKGYRTVGGMRASLYNALPHESVEALRDYIKEFERANPC